MANHKSAIKRNKQNIKRREHNRHYKSMMRSATKKFRQAAESGEVENAKSLFPKTVSMIQKVSQKGIIHKNQASRRIKRLHKLLKSIEANA